ncbi:phytanoyl-CoA dioxygenase family protein, partial [Actinomadura sp. LOL_016]|uniref:phytanoyl-CoA dioxygenase family protein n=1 Tax=Actinomadura sp. LOL_016 TaxID=3345411 RepID=UPI003A86AE72
MTSAPPPATSAPTVPRLAIKAAYFLSDLTPDAGVTMVVPGSHTRTGPVTVP